MTTARALRALAALAVLAASPATRADLFSPGELARAHHNLEGLQNCTRCHEAGKELSQAKCLECHKELAGRIARGQGYHGRIPAAERACEKCHAEHRGLNAALVDWGKEGRRGFDHSRTGFDLKGKHRTTDCAKCHDKRLVKDPDVLAMLQAQPNRASQLGAPRACNACHVDEHRGQLGPDCARCHGEDAWKPARLFKHAKTAYPLVGKHARVECARCHRPEQDTESVAVLPAQVGPVNAKTFARYKGMPLGACTDCHKDPHQGSFGASCTGCHTPVDWKKLTGAGAQRTFHEKTRYPLRGKHLEVKCEACHGPFPGQKAVFKGLAFARCTDCHSDSHVGQLDTLAAAARIPSPRPAAVPAATATAPAAPAVLTCDACHTVGGWVPARFDLPDHQKLIYPLEGAHRAVACVLCHPKDPKLEARFPAALRKDLGRRKRPVQVSTARFDLAKANACLTCHRDIHGGQFNTRVNAEGCGGCHGLDSFHKVRFDHAKESRYPLDGKHATTACGSCHRATEAGGMVRYKPLPVACAGCHADAHAGQFLVKGSAEKTTDCARCHATSAWKDLKFKHAPPFTRYVLDGRHEKLECARCHLAVKVAGADVRRYRPLPQSCEACHQDFHKGSMRGFAPASVTTTAPAPKAASTSSKADLKARPAAPPLPPPPDAVTHCAACHTTLGWGGATGFAHERTGFPLEGAHRTAMCQGCHSNDLSKPVPRACSACHQDVHVRRLGRTCEKCHQATSWSEVTFDADAHRRGNFPLTGRHAFVNCESCHGDRRDRGFDRPTRECLGCHQADHLRALSSSTFDHGQAGVGNACQTCHSAWRFSPAGLPVHDDCFQLSGGPHRGIKCLDCHTAIPPGTDLTARPLACTAATQALWDCTRCHSCGSHPNVSGVPPSAACSNYNCYVCHSFSSWRPP